MDATPHLDAGGDDGYRAEAELLSGAANDAGLRHALESLALLATGADDLRTDLSRIAVLAVQAIPGADGVGLTLNREGQADTIAASSEFVTQVDEIQYGLGEGPCISAAVEGRTMRSGSLGGDRAWPRFGPRVGRLGVHSALSLPLNAPGGVIGAMNVYAHSKDAFDERAAALAELFAIPAAIAAHNAQTLHQARELAEQLRTALTTRSVIDQAIGILVSRTGSTEQEAFNRLRTISQQEHVKVSTIAQRIRDEAVARARARHNRPTS